LQRLLNDCAIDGCYTEDQQDRGDDPPGFRPKVVPARVFIVRRGADSTKIPRRLGSRVRPAPAVPPARDPSDWRPPER
jgi:hypothetical protein